MKPIQEHLKPKIEELRRMLQTIPKEKRKEAVRLGMELGQLKKERNELMKKDSA